MKLDKFLWLCAIIFFASCGSNKKVVKNTPKKTQRTKVVRKKVAVKESVKKEPVVVTEEKNTVVKTASTPVKKTNVNITQEYINTYSTVAIEEMHKYKIPASITLAQGVLESGSGRSVLAIKSNNHFGIKCHKGWKGHSVSHDDDELGECFRKYKHPKTSYEDHSKFLTSRSRYASLFKLKLTDYVGWAHGLKKAGYATDKKYPNKLISIIKKYNLDQYDVKGANVSYNNQENQSSSTYNTTYYKVKKGDTLYSISRKYNKTVAEIKRANGLQSNALSIGQELVIP